MPGFAAETLIDRRVPEQGPIAAQVVFPAPRAGLAPRPLRHVTGCALLRLRDGSVWMLRSPGHAWTPERLRGAGQLLCQLREAGLAAGALSERLGSAISARPVEVVQPLLERADPSQWDIPRIAEAVVERGDDWRARVSRRESHESRVDGVAGLLSRALDAALEAFVADLDPAVRRAATAAGQLDAAVYNYLVDSAHRRYRTQFAATFPSLVPAVVAATRGSLGAEIASIVDDGRPVVRALAERWGVRPGVVRYLIGRPLETLGRGWAGRLHDLATLLDALVPEDLPRDAADWAQFEDVVVVGERLFGRPVWQSRAALDWLREARGVTARGSAAARARWLPDPPTLAAVGRLRLMLVAVLRHEVRAAGVHLEPAVQSRMLEAVGRFVLGRIPADLPELVARFDDELARRRSEHNRSGRTVPERSTWPLLPAPFVSSDGDRAVRPLTTRTELEQHGQALGNCLGTDAALRYLERGTRRYSFVVGLFDPRTGEPCSTAEIRVRGLAPQCPQDVTVLQHTGAANATPSPACARAVEELRHHCCTAEVARHLGQRDGGQRALDVERSARQAEQVAAIKTAVTAVIGEVAYATLLAGACGR